MLRDITQVVQQGSVDMETTMEKQRENKNPAVGFHVAGQAEHRH